MSVRLNLNHAGIRISAGYRLRLALSTAGFMGLWLNRELPTLTLLQSLQSPAVRSFRHWLFEQSGIRSAKT